MAKIIVQVAFNAVRFQDVAKRQITTCVKKYGLATSKNIVSMEKEKDAQLLSKYLLNVKNHSCMLPKSRSFAMDRS